MRTTCRCRAIHRARTLLVICWHNIANHSVCPQSTKVEVYPAREGWVLTRYVVTTRRDARADPRTPTALDVASSHPGVRVLAYSDPHMVTIEASSEIADQLRQKLSATH